MTTSENQPMSGAGAALLAKIEDRTARIGVVGLGYVGLPLIQAVHDAGYPVIGYDVDQTKIDMLERGESYLKHLGDVLVETLKNSDRFIATTDEEVLGQADIIVLCVPTPITLQREPDLRFVLGSAQTIGTFLMSSRQRMRSRPAFARARWWCWNRRPIQAQPAIWWFQSLSRARSSAART